uniref:HMG box domain-containing protein n=1 Tax=Hanusia phi TaxID=3032 RepID=A0A7S0HC27_9CRYP|mmetsp:Transcript_1236/g.2669  ORF Transcript_1236/g.2669 Transcript_1236/m.2669 type:complete len:207 (+) Transcript_1236:22-642(+)
MPKKESAKTREANKKAEAEDARAQAAEDAYWSHGSKDSSKHSTAEEKRLAELRRKEERKKLEEEESASLSNKKSTQPAKVTQAQIAQNLMFMPPKKEKKKQEPEIERNINHLRMEESRMLAEKGIERKEASGVDAATDLLTNLSTEDEKGDAHPERRRKAAFKAYEEREIPRIRADNPGLKLSQIKEIIFKNWQKSPENPMNQEAA